MFGKVAFTFRFFRKVDIAFYFFALLCVRKINHVFGFNIAGDKVFYLKLDRGNTPNQKPKELYFRLNDITTFYEVFYKEIYRVDIDLEPKVIVDLGAHVGFTSNYLQTKFPNAKIYCVEPTKESIALLSKNVDGDITHKAIASYDGQAAFNIESNSVNNKMKNHGSRIVDTITMYSFMKEKGLTEIDILKIDIEGAEKELFLSLGLWKDKVKYIMIELHDGCEELKQKLAQSGIKYKIV